MDNELSKKLCYVVADIYQVPKIVSIIPDLVDLDMLFIGDFCKEIWMQHGFIEYCNDHNIVVVSFVVRDDKNIKKFKNLYHHMCDIIDRNIIETLLKKDMLI